MRRLGIALVLVACTHAGAPAVATTQPAQPQPASVKPQKQVVTDTHVELLDPIKFFAGSPSIDPTSKPTLDAVATTLLGNPSLKLVEVIAYGDDAVPSLRVSVAVSRAQAVVAELIARGVDSRRLRASGEAVATQGNGPGPTFLILARDP